MKDENASQQENSELEPEASQDMDSTDEAHQQVEEGMDELRTSWRNVRLKLTNTWMGGARPSRLYQLQEAHGLATANVPKRFAMVIRRFLEVLDDLDLALMNRPREGDEAGWAERY
jgi:hypothetical protein